MFHFVDSVYCLALLNAIIDLHCGFRLDDQSWFLDLGIQLRIPRPD